MGTIIGRYILPHPPVLIPEIGKKQIKEAKKNRRSLCICGERDRRKKA